MLQHFLSGGMGLRMLCDWVVIWRKKGQEPNFCLEKYLSFIRQSKIEGFLLFISKNAPFFYFLNSVISSKSLERSSVPFKICDNRKIGMSYMIVPIKDGLIQIEGMLTLNETDRSCICL